MRKFEYFSYYYENENFETGYFGWLSNYFPDYDFEERIPTNVIVNNKIGRPFIYPHENFEHPFVKDFYNGIEKKEAEKRINRALNNS
ncbi:DUF2199 domain-containing protein [Chryseobacterium populi]|uniref:DUF2199 domain-containing protein n=1 Tax=Chryseobacterium populi TaxID=1144316 RepID=UPI001EE685AC|nr:DUF2199 domain-containing protein [Chryseobacterium populi]